MKKKKTNIIRNHCRKLAELVLEGNILDANELLLKIVNEAQEKRERDICKIILEADDDEEIDADDTELDDADDEGGDEEDTGDEGGEDELGNDLGGGMDSTDDELPADEEGGEEGEEEGATNADLNDFVTGNIKIECNVNKTMIAQYTNLLCNLMSKLNSLGLDKKERKYIKFSKTIEYYMNALSELQDMCIPTVSQDKVESALNGVEKNIKAIEAKLKAELGEGDAEDVKSVDELDEDDTEDETEADEDDTEGGDEGEESEGEEEEPEEEEEESSDEGEEEESEEEESEEEEEDEE